MTAQWAGLVLAMVTFGTIAFGHVMVRKVNYLYGTKPAPALFVLSLLLMTLSLKMGDLASAALGIIGITTFWDGIELYRQEKRIRRGHAPANPNRPVEPK